MENNKQARSVSRSVEIENGLICCLYWLLRIKFTIYRIPTLTHSIVQEAKWTKMNDECSQIDSTKQTAITTIEREQKLYAINSIH